MKLEINPYDEQLCKEIVEKEFMDAIRTKFGTAALLFYEKSMPEMLLGDDGWKNPYRMRGAIPTPRSFRGVSLVPCAIFYYLHYLTSHTTDTIFDLGCGDNMLKDIIPNTYGVDPEGTFRDDYGRFDSAGAFAKQHYQRYSAALAINSLHFAPVNTFVSRVNLFSTMIKPGGRGMVAFNAIRMIERTPEEDLISIFDTVEPTPEMVESYFDTEIKKLNLNLLVVDNFVSQIYNDWMDGNVRLVFEV